MNKTIQMKQILILGGGFAGVSTALGLRKNLKNNKDIAITLIDEESYHLFHANLYEVATSPEELTSLAQLKKSVALPFKEIFEGKDINFIQGKISQVDLQKQTVSIGERSFTYDYLVLALGATNNFYGIEGAEENAYTLQSVNGALRIRNRIEFLAQMHRSDVTKKELRIVVAGGGFAGVEIAAELKGYLDFLSWENAFPREKIETLIIEGSESVVPGMGEQVQVDVGGRLRSLGVRIQTGSLISKVDPHFLEFKSGEKLSYDCLIWTAGVKANSVPMTPEIPVDRGGRITVNSKLQIPSFPNVFVLGDKACVMDKNNSPLPGTAMHAISHAEYLSEALPTALKNRTLIDFRPRQKAFIIPLGGKWMILKYGPAVYITGYLAFLIREFVFLKYFASLLGWYKAWNLIYFENKIYSEND